MSEPLAIGQVVKLWVGIRLDFGYPPFGVINRFLPDYPGGSVYEVRFNDGDTFACLRPEWLFPALEAEAPPQEGTDE